MTSPVCGLDCPEVEMKHILVVEDDLPTLTLIQKVLETAGHRVTGVHEGMAALRSAQADTPDLVVLDLLISGIDGYGVCSLLKRRSDFHSPVIILSGRTSEKDVRAAYDAGADAFLHKPVKNTELLAKVTELLAHRPSSIKP